MSWKIDALALGAIGIGAYFVFVNRDKITDWLGSALLKPLADVNDTIADAGAGAGTNAANFIDKTTTIITKEIPYDFAANFTNFLRTIPGQECFGGSHAPGCPGAVAEIPKCAVINGQGYSGTPEFLTKKAVESSISAPFNPGLNVLSTQKVAVSSPSPASTPTPAPTGTQKIGLTAEQRYAQTFAMPGSPAWIAAGLK